MSAVPVAPPPATPTGAPVPPKPMKPRNPRVEELARELVMAMGLSGGSVQTFIQNFITSLPQTIDDATRDFGADLYLRMLNDPACSGPLDAIKLAALQDGMSLQPAFPKPGPGDNRPEAKFDYEESMKYVEFFKKDFDALEIPLEDILFDALDAMAFGHWVAEKVIDFKPGDDWLHLTKLKPKDFKSTAFVVDAFKNVLGLISTSWGSSTLLAIRQVINNANGGDALPAYLIPKEKFCILQFGCRGSDPRGSSCYRQAYNPWQIKQHIWVAFLKYLVQFGTPSIAAILPELVESPEYDDQGQAVLVDGIPSVRDLAEEVLSELLKFQGGSAGVFPYGTELKPIELQGNGEVFTNAIEMLDRQIAMAVIKAARALLEAEHGSKADTGEAQNVMGALVNWCRRKLQVMVKRDIIDFIMVRNWGEESLKYAPIPSLSPTAKEDKIQKGNMVANLKKAGMIHMSQYERIFEDLDLPPADMDAWEADIVAEQEMELQLSKDVGRMIDPTAGKTGPKEKKTSAND